MNKKRESESRESEKDQGDESPRENLRKREDERARTEKDQSNESPRSQENQESGRET